jgi:CheY-like chemotaxis protein
MMTPDPTLVGRRVLIVEDDFLIAASLSNLLEEHGCIVSGPVFTVKEAVEVMDREAVDGAILDYKVQDGLALAVAERLRQQGIPFVFVTGYQREHLPAELRTAPYLAKPVLPDVLIEVIARVWPSR